MTRVEIVMADAQVLFSIRPRFADLIMAGRKSAELRRIRPRLNPGDVILFYATLPVQAVVVRCRVERIVSAPCEQLWSITRESAAVSHDIFLNYYEGRSMGHAIFLGDVHPLECPIGLNEIKERWPDFRPPQSYRYIPRGIAIAPKA